MVLLFGAIAHIHSLRNKTQPATAHYWSYLSMNIKFSSEEELLSFLKRQDIYGLDSEFSKSSDELVEEFSAKGMDLNRWWVYTPTDWICPACKRKKSQIVRLNQHGYLTGHLHEHHDHMSDFVMREFTRISESKKVVVADIHAQRFVARTAFAFSAYDNTVICSDCNSADSKAKILVKTPKEFSFSPAEIGDFIKSTPNTEHEIDTNKASAVWDSCREMFFTRSELVLKVAELAASNSHWYQPSERTAKQTERMAEYYLDYYGMKQINPLEPEKLLYKPNKFSGAKNSWRKDAIRRISNPPTESELQHLINLSGQWKKAADNWRCPICNRSKFSCVRKSNTGKWSFLTSTSKVLHCDSADDYYQIMQVCNDCSTTATHIGKEVEVAVGTKLSYASAVISSTELKKIIASSPHSKHLINNDEVENILPILIERVRFGNVLP